MMFMYSADLGLSSFNAVLIEEGKIKKKKRVFIKEKESIQKQIKDFFSDEFFSGKTIALTGAYSTKVNSIKGKKLIKINEIHAIASGSAFLSKEKNFLAASAGTGTAFVSVRKNKASHIAGTAIGGKTILGLSELITKEKEFKKIEASALKGNCNKTDLMLFDVYKKGIGLLKENVSVAHFGELKSKRKKDLNAGIFNLVCQGISTHALLAAKAARHKKIVFTGSLSERKLFKKTFKECQKTFNLAEGIFPKNTEYATAIGAALISNKTKKKK